MKENKEEIEKFKKEIKPDYTMLYAFAITVFILGTIFSIVNMIQKPNYSNPPCWYYSNESIREIKMYGINYTEVDVLLNEDRSQFFVIEKNTGKDILECIR